MIKTMLHNIKTGETRWGDEALISEWKGNPDLWLWADFEKEDLVREKELFVDVFNLHPLVISDAQRVRHSPKLESFDDYFFLLMQGLNVDATDIDIQTIQLAFFVGERFLVTRRMVESINIDTIWHEANNGNIELSRGPAHVVYCILRKITDRYTKLVEGLEQKLEDIEQEMFVNPRDALLESLIGYGRTLKRLRRIFNYHQSIFTRLSRSNYPHIGEQNRHEYTDLFEHTERLESLSNLYKELTDDLMNGYISVTSHRLNQIMKVLTVVTVILLPLTLIAGIYGMNFEEMPELKIKGAYYVLLSVMGLIAVCLLLIFRKMRWL
jgi:magnesium transporter